MGAPLNTAYFTNLTAQINAASSCAELQALATVAAAALNDLMASITAQCATITPALALLTPPTNPTAVVTWVQNFISQYLTPGLASYATYVATLTALAAQVAAIIAAINAASANLGSCSITIPTITPGTIPSPPAPPTYPPYNPGLVVADSIAGAGTVASPLELVNDTVAPGSSMVYGTNAAGARGWYAAGGGGGGTYPGGVSTSLYYWFKGDLLSGSGGAAIQQLTNQTPAIGAIIPVNATGAGATIGAAALNSLNVANFVGSSAGNYTFPQLPPGPLTQSSIFIVFKATSAAVAYVVLGGNTNALQYGTDGAGHINIVSDFVTQIGASAGVITAGTWYQANVTYNSVTGTYAFRRTRATDGSGTNAITISATTSGIGYNVAGGAASQNFNGSIAELIIYSRVLSPAEITAVENYLNAKWGV